MTLPFNPNVVDTSTPPIPEAYGWVPRYGGALGPLINMAQAAPSAPPHAELLKRFGLAAADPAGARYGPIGGDAVLKQAYARDVNDVYGGDVSPDEVAMTAGCNLAFVVAMLALAQAGDAVLLPAPWYFNHRMALTMLGIEARPLPLSAAQGFVPDVETARRLIDKRLKAIVLVTPNNPTGAVYPPATLAAFHELCRAHGLWLVVDETYRDFLPAGQTQPHELFTTPSWRDSVMALYSFSKAYCMPGHRLGAITASGQAMVEIEKVLDTLQICAPRPVQSALAWGIGALDAWKSENRNEINARGAACRKALAAANAWTLSSLGAYFAFVKHPFDGVSSLHVAEAMAVKSGVLSLPGVYFGPGCDDHVRLAFANADAATIAELPERLRGLSL